MKLLIAVERLGARGGMERALDVTIAAVRARGVEVLIVAREIAGGDPGVAVEHVPWSDEHDAPDPRARAACEALVARFAPHAALAVNVTDAGVVEALRGAPRLAYQVHDHRPFCPNGDRVFPRTGRPCTAALGFACMVHALSDGCAYGPRPRTLRLIRLRERLRDAIASCDTVFVASAYVATRARESGVPASRIIELALPLADDAYATPVIRSPDRRVAFAGRLVPQKGLASLVRALGTIPAQRRPSLAVFGDGPARNGAARLAGRLAVNVTWHGVVDTPAVRAGMDDAACVALPSLWAEPFGLAGIEAFARGRPVVAYDTGGVRAWLEDGVNGLAVPRGDEGRLGSAIDRLLDDEPLRERLGARARLDAERYRAGPIIDALLDTLVPGAQETNPSGTIPWLWSSARHRTSSSASWPTTKP